MKTFICALGGDCTKGTQATKISGANVYGKNANAKKLNAVCVTKEAVHLFLSPRNTVNSGVVKK